MREPEADTRVGGRPRARPQAPFGERERGIPGANAVLAILWISTLVDREPQVLSPERQVRQHRVSEVEPRTEPGDAERRYDERTRPRAPRTGPALNMRCSRSRSRIG